MNRKKLTAIFIFCVGMIVAQTKNELLDRKFWQTNPTVQTVQQKISEGNNPTALNPYGFDAVVYAILEKTNNTAIKHLLAIEGNDVNKLTHDKRTYVFWAAYSNNVELMKHLIANNARMDLKDSHNFSVLTFAAATGQTNTKIYDLCIDNGIDIKNDTDEHGANALLLASGSLKDFSLIDYFVSKGVDIQSRDHDGNGIFNYVAKGGNKDLLVKLKAKGISTDKLNKKGENALFLATRGSRKGYNSLEYLQYLESIGLEVNITNKDGNNPLHNLAYGNKDLNTFQYFLNKGVNPNQVNKEGNSVLMHATYRNSSEIVSLFANKTKDINHKNKDGNSALTAAVAGNSKDVTNLILNKGGDIKVIDTKGNSLAYYLIESYSPRYQEDFNKKKALLVEKGLNLNALQAGNNTLFHLAIDKNSVDLLKGLSSLNLDVNAKNSDGLTVLHKAVMSAKNTEIIEYLLSIGAKKSITTEFGETVFDLAKENEILSSKNIDINFLK
ncbi:Ankyrin repeat-containing protein [Tenacibaculum sp. MAR_2009_124]|uniref:ankyrin repeat domain-containing protein n=1 Tax=Tenacibaculum sp. MAR_2009_124 TaxID=1250059 RepID=UPI000899AEC6|nr:ankyrin repeat domain-containing protein [Tenacibaculum sp. MAR_2009_124]SEB36394.1 Ankyrin repeat-containing protein [Tenacibaculum sp. MAR_2009_124]